MVGPVVKDVDCPDCVALMTTDPLVKSVKWLYDVPPDKRAQTKAKIALWTTDPHAERIHTHTLWDALEDWWDMMVGWPTVPETITVIGLTPMKVELDIAEFMVEHALETLEEEYGDPDGGRADDKCFRNLGCVEMAALTFQNVVREEYQPWMHEPAVEMVVDVQAWLKERGDE